MMRIIFVLHLAYLIKAFILKKTLVTVHFGPTVHNLLVVLYARRE